MEELHELEEFRFIPTPTAVAEVVSTIIEVLEANGPDHSAMPNCHDYDLISLLGQGGMGNVYRARNKASGTEVAIKVIHPSLVTDACAVQRFEQEARAASSLTHSNLVAVYDYGKTNVGTPFLVMDLLNGASLADVIKKEGFLDVPRALDVFIQICDALTHAHCKGVVHRDLKPSNILLTKNDHGAELVKIIDFGIAKLLAKTETSITQTGEVFGSPAYMSPEQCLGLQTDARSDVYSLGCIMYESLTGHLPFGGDNPIQTIVQHINEQPKLFGSDCNDLNIPDYLRSLILNTMEKDSNKRYQTMEELRNDLERIKDGARPLRERVPADKKEKRKKRIRKQNVIAVAAVILTGVAATAVGWATDAYHGSLFPEDESSFSRNGIAGSALSKSFELRDINNRLLYTSKEANNISEAINEALGKGVDLTRANFSGMTLQGIGSLNGRHGTDHSAWYSDTAPVGLFRSVNNGDTWEEIKGFSSHQQCRAKLAGADFSRSKLIGCTFSGCDLRGAKFTGAASERCNFTGANLTDADFTEANFPGALFPESISGAKFARGKFGRGYFCWSNLTGADFTGAELKEAELDAAILSHAKFQEADLTGASLNDCMGANFKGAKNANVNAKYK